MNPPSIIEQLVDRFDRNRDAYRSGRYNETQLRREFVDPFFEALGWDVNNTRGYAEAYKDVIHEDAVKIGGATKAPDYSFRVGGTRKFFVETKRPSVNIRDDFHPAFQLRRYAWSAKLPLSILTDFEEMAVYDCRIKPDKADKPSTGRTLYLRYTDYGDRWEEIGGIFSKEAVLQGSFDRYAESSRAKRGTATVDDAFLKEIESWREMLARNLALRNDLSQRELNFAVQRTIDRIIFLRIAEDRGIEEYARLQGLLNGPRVYERLKVLYQRADERYNSGLFHFQPEKGREDPDELTLALDIDDKVLKEILRSLYYPDSPYEFSVLPADILGQVYEQFLGKVIRLSPGGHRAVVEEKPEVRKAGGVYYTPTYIVDYIGRETVGKLVEGKKPGPRGAASKLRILDPACGSGGFLLGAYQFLLDWHLGQYVEEGAEKHSRVLYRGPGGDWRLTTAEKKRILLNNIYGVDIDPQAVETTKLSLLLKVLEGESDESLRSQLALFHERALPDLGDNIKSGNSLISSDFYEGKQLGLLDNEERYRVNPFDWEAEFPEIMAGGGFDAVIGNPPYGAYLYDPEKSYLRHNYPNQSYQLDSYLLFLERAVRDLLVSGGYYGMIIPNPWLTNILQKDIRRFVLANTQILQIVHFRFPVFRGVTVDTEVVILQKEPGDKGDVVVTIVDAHDTFRDGASVSRHTQIHHQQDKWSALQGGVINIFLKAEEEFLAAKCLHRSVPLGSVCTINVGIKPYQTGKGKPPQTKETVSTRPFDSDRALDPTYRPYLRGSDIQRYMIAPVQPRYLKYGPWLAEPRPAANFNAPVKLVMRQTGDSLVAALDTNKFLCLNNMHVLVPMHIHLSPAYLLGVINSKLLNWYYQTRNPEVGEALAEVKKTNVAELPIRLLDFSDPADCARHDRMVGLVERMLALHKQLAAAKMGHEKTLLQRQIEATDRQIDRLVYELYGLTEDEVAVVEGGR